MSLFIKLQPAGPNKWAGRIYNADDGKTYESSVTMVSSGTLNVRGCMGTLCAGETGRGEGNWPRPFIGQEEKQTQSLEAAASGGLLYDGSAAAPSGECAQRAGSRPGSFGTGEAPCAASPGRRLKGSLWNKRRLARASRRNVFSAVTHRSAAAPRESLWRRRAGWQDRTISTRPFARRHSGHAS
jgi:hypothetical protein